jgi:alkylation response protein AidB-like acyl-CoA dehydrogenase
MRQPATLDRPIASDGSWEQLTAEQRSIRQRAKDLAETEFKPWAAHWDETEEFPQRSLDLLRESGLLATCVPEEYGGRGLGILEGCLIVEELAKACLSSAMIAQSFLNGPWRAIYVLGEEPLRQRYLPRVATGECHFAIAMSEPVAGSAGTDLIATLEPDGQGFRLSGVKSWVTGGREANAIIVFARLPGTVGPYGIGAVVIDQGAPGMAEPKVEAKMGMRGIGEAVLVFEDVWVDPEQVLIRPDAHSKRGSEILVNQFNPERCGNSAMCVGLAQAALEDSVAHVRARHQFGRPLSDFQGLQWMIADMALDVDVARMLTWRAAGTATVGNFPAQRETVSAKLYSSEMVQRVTNMAIEIHGARGYSRQWPVERYFRDGRGLAMGGGTPEIMRNILGGVVIGQRRSQRA